MQDTHELDRRQELNNRLFRVQASHERAITLRNALSALTGSQGIITNRHPGSDTQHLELTQDAAQQLLDLLDAGPDSHEGEHHEA